MLDDFVVRAALAGIGVALASGPLGCFVVWRRIAYFGDATAHAAILGVALALLFAVSVFAGVLAVTMLVAVSVTALSGRGIAMDTLLGVAAPAGLACGVVAVALAADRPVNIEAYLFGEILAVSRGDLAVIWSGAAIVLALVAWRWSALLTSTLSPDLARGSGIVPERETMALMVSLAVVVAVSIKVVGALLITAMLIIPAATARPFSRTPEAMAVGAVLLGAASVIAGLAVSWYLDTPTGPTIVTLASFLFLMSLVASLVLRRL